METLRISYRKQPKLKIWKDETLSISCKMHCGIGNVGHTCCSIQSQRHVAFVNLLVLVSSDFGLNARSAKNACYKVCFGFGILMCKMLDTFRWLAQMRIAFGKVCEISHCPAKNKLHRSLASQADRLASEAPCPTSTTTAFQPPNFINVQMYISGHSAIYQSIRTQINGLANASCRIDGVSILWLTCEPQISTNARAPGSNMAPTLRVDTT